MMRPLRGTMCRESASVGRGRQFRSLGLGFPTVYLVPKLAAKAMLVELVSSR